MKKAEFKLGKNPIRCSVINYISGTDDVPLEELYQLRTDCRNFCYKFDDCEDVDWAIADAAKKALHKDDLELK
jgi:hypothetical protein